MRQGKLWKKKKKEKNSKNRRQCSILSFNDIPDQREEETTTLQEILLLGDPLLQYQGVKLKLPIQLVTNMKSRSNFDEATREVLVDLDCLLVSEFEEVTGGGSEIVVDVSITE